MARNWLEKVTGAFDEKKRYRQYKARVQELPPAYREANEAVERYLLYSGGISNGDIAVSMLEDLADLFEQSAASATPIRDVVGEDPVEFVEAFLQNYSEGAWINKEKKKLNDAIERAEGEEGSR